MRRREIASGLRTLEWMILEREMPLLAMLDVLEMGIALEILGALEEGDV